MTIDPVIYLSVKCGQITDILLFSALVHSGIHCEIDINAFITQIIGPFSSRFL